MKLYVSTINTNNVRRYNFKLKKNVKKGTNSYHFYVQSAYTQHNKPRMDRSFIWSALVNKLYYMLQRMTTVRPTMTEARRFLAHFVLNIKICDAYPFLWSAGEKNRVIIQLGRVIKICLKFKFLYFWIKGGFFGLAAGWGGLSLSVGRWVGTRNRFREFVGTGTGSGTRGTRGYEKSHWILF
jgi:hypothetical protein